MDRERMEEVSERGNRRKEKHQVVSESEAQLTISWAQTGFLKLTESIVEEYIFWLWVKLRAQRVATPS